MNGAQRFCFGFILFKNVILAYATWLLKFDFGWKEQLNFYHATYK